MRTAIFNSCFKEDMQLFMEYRTATFAWNTYRLDNYRLSSFDRFLAKISYDKEIVSQTIINQWLDDANVPDASVNGYLKTVRSFMKYRADMGKTVYLPPFRKEKDLYIPYIFSDDELSNIFAIADDYPIVNKQSSIPHIHMEIAVLIRLLYCCGLRLNEALILQFSHLDLENGVICIIHSKNNKQRLVPMHETLKNLMIHYCKAMKIYGVDNAFLFPGKNEHLSPITAERQFKKILKKAGIIKGNEEPHKRGPCLHCLRHRFMFAAFKKLEMAGYSVDMASPYLSVYCGNSKETGSNETAATDSSAVLEETTAKESEEFGKEFTCLYDKWDLYKATQLSETTFKIENWGRFDAGEDGDPFKLDYDVCVISSTDASTEFKWLDDTHTAFSISMSDENNSYMEGIVNVCFAIESNDSVANFTYLHDKWDLYKATQLTETTFKIENWGRFDAGEDGDPFKLEYDVCVISTADASIDFKWLDDTHTAFSITLHDKENSYWTEACLVTFVVSSTE